MAMCERPKVYLVFDVDDVTQFVVMDMEDYEREKAEKKLLMKLQEAEEAVKDENAWMSLDELKKSVGV